MSTPPLHWPAIARVWHHVGPPLRPAAEDLEFLSRRVLGPWNPGQPPRALILGVTQELFRLPWPAGTCLRAADRTPGMIEALWPGPREWVDVAEWTALPLPDQSRDLVLCDGGLHLLSHPEGHHAWVRELQRVLAPGGLVGLRLFVPPPTRETPEDVLTDLLQGRVPNLNVLKLRLGMALQSNPRDGVALGVVWQRLADVAPDFGRLARDLGWDLEHLEVIHTYRGSATRYHFLDTAQVRELFCHDPGGFKFVEAFQPDYLLGERCPTVVFRRVASSGRDE